MDTKKIVSELTAIVESRLGYYEELVALADAQREFLVRGNHEELADNLKKHDPILVEIGRLDKREEALAGLLSQEDFTPSCRQTLRLTAQTAAHLAKLTRINAELLENAKEFVAFSIGVLSKSVSEQNSDAGCDPNGALLLDQKV